MVEKNEMLKLLREARAFYRHHDYARAEAVLQELARAGCKYADAFNMLGLIAHGKGWLREASKHFEDALRLNPRYVEAAMNLAVVYSDLGEVEKARELYERLQQFGRSKAGGDALLMAKVANMYAEIGDIFAREAQWERASQDYVRALELCPQFVDIRRKLAAALTEMGRFDEAEKELVQLIRQKPDYVPARVQLGLTCYAAGRLSAALDTWYAVLREFPENREAKMYARMVLGAQEETKEAVK